jgi:hypothetical protein
MAPGVISRCGPLICLAGVEYGKWTGGTDLAQFEWRGEEVPLYEQEDRRRGMPRVRLKAGELMPNPMAL